MNIFMLQLSAYLAVGLWQALAIYLITEEDESFGLKEIFICAIMWPVVWMMLAPAPGKILNLLKGNTQITIKAVIINGAIGLLLIVLFRFLMG